MLLYNDGAESAHGNNSIYTFKFFSLISWDGPGDEATNLTVIK